MTSPGLFVVGISAWGAAISAGASRQQDCRYSAQHNHEVASEGARAGVFHVQLYPLFISGVAAAFDLPQAGQARADGAIVAIELTILGDFVFDDLLN